MCASNPLNCIFLSLWHFWQKALVLKIFLSLRLGTHLFHFTLKLLSVGVSLLKSVFFAKSYGNLKVSGWKFTFEVIYGRWFWCKGQEMKWVPAFLFLPQEGQGSRGSQYSFPLHWYSKDICSCAIKEEDIRAIRGEGAWIDGEMLTSVRSPTNIPSRPFYSPIAA